MSDKPYHHGDLRAALLAATEAELAAHGIEGFSLRAVAKRAGVSHAAPAHHFGDANGLLTALAAEGYGQFMAMLHAREAVVAHDPVACVQAAGLGYVDFALARPALFRLIFSSDRPDYADPVLKAVSDASYDHLVAIVTAAGGGAGEVAAVWAMAHGIADLIVAGRLKPLSALIPEARDAAVRALMARTLSSQSAGP